MQKKVLRSVRLPDHITPQRYKITLKPDLEKFTFAGEEDISLVITKPVKTITLHAVELAIDKVSVIDSSQKKQKGKISYDKETETATFTFPQLITKGEAEITIHFRGILNDKMRGFYRSRYEVDGESRFIATTQFEATDARRAFPCIDEPSAKAIFDVTFFIPSHFTAISNTTDDEVLEHEGGYKLVRFRPTPKMSTYLLAFIVGEFESIETKTKEGIVVRVFVTRGKQKQAKFALEAAAKILSFYNDYFKILYPLPVLDLIAVPDFAHGAMENWGAVTYRESTLLVDEEHSSSANKQWVALVIAHELAHMWFGDLVTMEWWTHLWLNEGFASYIEYLAVDNLFPEWDIWTQFINLEQGPALRLDSLKNTHPIEVAVHHPSEISEIFDKVSYSKGASIIRMLALFLGYKDFRDGLRLYLAKHQYGNARTEDLWKAFETVSKKPVSKIMKNWTEKPGHPIIHVEEKGQMLSLSQSRFFSSSISKKTKDTTRWQIPLQILFPQTAKPVQYLMERTTMTISKKSTSWIKLNASDASFIRVKYSSGILTALESAVAHNELSIIDRLGIIRDAFDMCESGELPTNKVLELAANFTKERDFTIWMEITAGIHKMASLLAEEEYYKTYERYCVSLFSDIVKRMGWEKNSSEKHTESLLRGIVLSAIGIYGDQQTVRHAQDLFRDSLSQKKSLDPDIRGTVYLLVAQNGGEKEQKIFLDRYRKETLQQEKDRIGRALASFRKKDLLLNTLQWSLSDDVRRQDAWRIVGSVGSNPYGRDLAWEFVKEKWNIFSERYGGGHTLSRLIDTYSEFTTLEKAKDIERFFKKNTVPEAARTINQVLEKIQSNASWLARDRKKIQDFLASRY